MNWSSFPFLRIAFAFIAGVLIFELYSFTLWQALFFLFLMSILYSALVLARNQLAGRSEILGALLLVILFFTGGVCISVQKGKHQNQRFQFVNKSAIVYGKVTEILKSSSKHKCIVSSNILYLQKNIKRNCHLHIVVTFEKPDTCSQFPGIGQYVLFKSTLKKISKSTNPETFDYARYLETKDVVLQAYVKSGDYILDENRRIHVFTGFAINCAKRASEILRTYIRDAHIRSIAEAILFGQKLSMEEALYKDYIDTGSVHVLSVSGLHVAIFISLFIWLFSKVSSEVTLWKIIKVVSLLLIVWFYAILTGMSPPVIRAGLMVSLYIIGTTFFKRTNNYNILSVSALLMVLYQPYYLFQTSFQFTYISLLSILYFQPKIKAWWTPNHKLTVFLWDLINVSLAAQIMIFPLSVYYFHQFPVYFVLSGLIAVPLVTLIIYVGTFFIISGFINSGIGLVLSKILSSLILCLNSLISFISHLPNSTIQQIWVSETGLFLMTTAIILLVLWLETRNLQSFYVLLVVCFFVIVENRWHYYNAGKSQNVFVYDNYGGTIVDIFDKNLNTTIITGNISTKTELFTTGNNRIKNGVNPTPTRSVEPAQRLFCIDNALVYLYESDRDVMRLKDPLSVKTLIILSDSCKKPQQLLNKLHPDIVVLPSDIPRWEVDKWKQYVVTYGFCLHNIKNNGAFVLSDYH